MVARRRFCTRSYVPIAQSGRECTIFRCVTTIRFCHLQAILPKLALLAYVDTLVVQAKRIDNKSVVHVKTTIDRRPLAVTNQKGWNATLSLNFDTIPHRYHIMPIQELQLRYSHCMVALSLRSILPCSDCNSNVRDV